MTFHNLTCAIRHAKLTKRLLTRASLPVAAKKSALLRRGLMSSPPRRYSAHKRLTFRLAEAQNVIKYALRTAREIHYGDGRRPDNAAVAPCRFCARDTEFVLSPSPVGG